MVSDVILMDRYRESILQMEDRNRNLGMPRFGLNESQEVETRIKEVYCQQFEENLLSVFDRRMTEQMTRFTVFNPGSDSVPASGSSDPSDQPAERPAGR